VNEPDPLRVPAELAINEATYQWSVRLFGLLRKVVRVNVRLHGDGERVAAGEVFLFNHFARFETFIPQYLIFLETGAYCRSVAAPEFFGEDDPFGDYLRSVGAVPNDFPALFPLLAAELLRGRKVVIFPEGGMVKDRRVLDPAGGYSVYSRSARRRRKHHTGAAAIALLAELVKAAVRAARAAGDSRRVEAWAEALGMEDGAALLAAAARPTRIVPANITFYPIRVGDNLLRRGAELVSRGLSRRLTEELLIEGNILLKDTDMDIRLGEPLDVSRCWRWWERALLARVVPGFVHPGEIFELDPRRGRPARRLLARAQRRAALRLRDAYMHRMYLGVTVNLSHLLSCLILRRLERGERSVARAHLCRTLYLAVKHAQRDRSVWLHRSLRDPTAYGELPEGRSRGLEQFLGTAESTGLVRVEGERLHLEDKLEVEHGFDEVRLENLVEVYANEVAPLGGVRRALAAAEREAPGLAPERLARLRFDDERIAHAWDREAFSGERHAEINRAETATEDGAPFLLEAPGGTALAVVLVHGFLASPAELRGLGERLHAAGHTVVGVRLKGHGTSPWDLRERSWEDWLGSLRRGYAIAAALAGRVCMVGFSTGGALALCHAAARPPALLGVIAACVPLKFRDPSMAWVPLVHRANRLVRRLPGLEGVMPFRVNDSEHPAINYRHMPVRALYELRLLVEEMERRIARIECPVVLYQASADPVVDPVSVERIAALLDPARTRVVQVASERHGILHEDIGGVQGEVVEQVGAWARAAGEEEADRRAG